MKLLADDKQFYKQIRTLAIPIILQGMIMAGVGIMDTFMVGKLGEAQLSAASLANQFILIYIIMCFGLGFGATVLTAQYFGSGDISSLKSIVTIMLRVMIVMSVLFTALTYIFSENIMSIYTPDKEIIEKGVLYFRILVFSFFFMSITVAATAVLRSVGEVRIALITSIITFFINIGFNYIFIFGKLGAPKMEIEGAALGTLIARIIEALIIGGYFFFREERIRYRLTDLFKSCKKYILIYISICLPVLVSDTLLALGNNMISVVMGHIGASFVAANAIISQVTRLTTVFTQGISSSSSIITGNTLGTGDKEKTYNQGKAFVLLAFILGIAASGILLLVTPLVINMFEITQETREIAYHLMYAMAVMIIFQSVETTLTKGVLRGGGDTKFLMMADVIFLWLVSVPLGYLLGIVWGMSAFFIFIGLKADILIKAIWCFKRLLSGKWMKKVGEIQVDSNI
ncbi:MAG: MATE family efflux transporter [Eubacteriales bacterium]